MNQHGTPDGANQVAVRPRLDRRYDVIQTRAPQYVGTRDGKADAIALAEWAARKMPPCQVIVYGQDGGTVEETRQVGTRLASFSPWATSA